MNELPPDDRLTPPKAGVSDRLHAAVSVGLKLLPIAGETLSEIFQSIIKPPLERRRAKWEEDFVEVIRMLDARGVNVDELFQDEAFVDNLLHVFSAAVKNSQDEKRKALKYGLLHCGLPNSLAEIKRHIFIRLIDDLGVFHIQLLQVLQNPLEWFRRQGRDASLHMHWNEEKDLLNAAFPGNLFDRELSMKLFRDIYQSGLSSFDPSPEGVRYVSLALAQPCTTELGNEFIAFISAP